jgi:hypothetical protein
MPEEIVDHDNATMLGGLGILAYVASMMTHEAVGHGGVCIALGGHNLMLTAWAERCSSGVGLLGISAAGPVAQFCAGLLAWLMLRHLQLKVVNLRWFLWFYLVFNLLISSGYVAFSGVTDFGDAAVLISGREPHALWRGILIVGGAAIYYFSLLAAAMELRSLVGNDYGGRRLNRLVWIPYLTIGVAACCAGALNRTMGPVLALGLAAASSFGGALGMVRLPSMMQRYSARTTSPTDYVRWNIAWLTLSVIVGAAFIFVLGPGLERPS